MNIEGAVKVVCGRAAWVTNSQEIAEAISKNCKAWSVDVRSRRKVLAGLSKYLLENPEIEEIYLNLYKDNIQFSSFSSNQKAA